MTYCIRLGSHYLQLVDDVLGGWGQRDCATTWSTKAEAENARKRKGNDYAVVEEFDKEERST